MDFKIILSIFLLININSLFVFENSEIIEKEQKKSLLIQKMDAIFEYGDLEEKKSYFEYFHHGDSFTLYLDLNKALIEYNTMLKTKSSQNFKKLYEQFKMKWDYKIHQSEEKYLEEMQKYNKKNLEEYFENNNSLDIIEGFFKEKITYENPLLNNIVESNIDSFDPYNIISIKKSPINDNHYVGFRFHNNLDSIPDFWGIIEKSYNPNIFFAQIGGEEIDFKYDGGLIYYKKSGISTTLIKMFSPKEENELKKVEKEGTGFLLTKYGYIVTNYHVVENSKSIEVLFPNNNNQTFSAKIEIKDIQNDIAILKIEDFKFENLSIPDIPFSISANKNPKVGQEVFTLGYPLGNIMGSKPRISLGIINSEYGFKDDPRMYQISNPIQPGNSGGPLFNLDGELIGITVSSLNTKYFYDNLGVIPQNVNFAIKISYLENIITLIPEYSIILERPNRLKGTKLEDQIKHLSPFIVKIISN